MKHTIDLGALFLIAVVIYTVIYAIIGNIIYNVKKSKHDREINQLNKANRRIKLMEEYADFVALSIAYENITNK